MPHKHVNFYFMERGIGQNRKNRNRTVSISHNYPPYFQIKNEIPHNNCSEYERFILIFDTGIFSYPLGHNRFKGILKIRCITTNHLSFCTPISYHATLSTAVTSTLSAPVSSQSHPPPSSSPYTSYPPTPPPLPSIPSKPSSISLTPPSHPLTKPPDISSNLMILAATLTIESLTL